MKKIKNIVSKKILVSVLGVAILAGLVLFLGVSLWDGTLCIARTGIAPAQALYEEPRVFQATVAEMKKKALESLIAQFDTMTGFFVYSAHPNGAVSKNDNDVRQLLASRVLAEESNENEALRMVHRQNLDTILREWYREEGDVGFVLRGGKSKLGANAMLLRVLVASPFFEQEQEKAGRLARGIMALTQSDGSLLPWYREPTYTYDADYLLTFYSGEAIVALLEYAEKTGDETVFASAIEIQDFYLGQYVENLSANYYPAYVPWHTQSLAKLYTRTHEQKYADAIFTLNDKVLEMQDRDMYIGRFYAPELAEYGSPHGSSDAVYTEGLAYAYEVAQMQGDTVRAKKYHDALVRAVHNLSGLQHRPRWWYFDDTEVSERLTGGIETNACSRWIRIDTTSHTIDALSKLLAR